eukprot:scaffold82205_cov33-Phaeocystis_antarctica.AAC.1
MRSIKSSRSILSNGAPRTSYAARRFLVSDAMPPRPSARQSHLSALAGHAELRACLTSPVEPAARGAGLRVPAVEALEAQVRAPRRGGNPARRLDPPVRRRPCAPARPHDVRLGGQDVAAAVLAGRRRIDQDVQHHEDLAALRAQRRAAEVQQGGGQHPAASPHGSRRATWRGGHPVHVRARGARRAHHRPRPRRHRRAVGVPEQARLALHPGRDLPSWVSSIGVRADGQGAGALVAG